MSKSATHLLGSAHDWGILSKDRWVTVEANQTQVFMCWSCVSRACACSTRLQSMTGQPVVREENSSVISFQLLPQLLQLTWLIWRFVMWRGVIAHIDWRVTAWIFKDWTPILCCVHTTSNTVPMLSPPEKTEVLGKNTWKTRAWVSIEVVKEEKLGYRTPVHDTLRGYYVKLHV